MSLLELKQITLKPEKKGIGQGFENLDLTIEPGEILLIRTDSVNDAHLLLKGLATLSYPASGSYLFENHKLDFSDYRNLLDTKKRIGYLTATSAMISNRSIRENLCMGQVYFDNDLSMILDEPTVELCRAFGLETILEERPVNLGTGDIRRAMLVRELLKKPRLMLIEHPETFSGYKYLYPMIWELREIIGQGTALIFFSFEDEIINAFPGRRLEIKKGGISFEDSPPADNG
jgi:macrolide transport system ATP-binding/permease protein